MNILIVDDTMIIRRLLTEILKKHKKVKKILIAENGEEAKESLKKEKIDLMLLDLLMPKMNGFEVLDYMNENGYNNIPIIVFSTDESKKFEALEKGAHEFLQKPISEAKIITTLKKYIEID